MHLRRLLLLLAALSGLIAVAPRLQAQSSAAVLTRFKRLVAKTQSLKASLELSVTSGKRRTDLTGTVALLRPTYALIRTYRGGKPDRIFAADGASTYDVQMSRQRYRMSKASERGEMLTGFAGPGLTPLSAFYTPDLLTAADVKYAGPRTVAGRKYEVLTYKGDGDPASATYYFGASGYLEGASMVVIEDGERENLTVWLRKLQLDAPLQLDQFAYTPPAAFEPIETPDPAATLLSEGEQAPDFSLPRLGGGKLTLSTLRQKAKAVLISFWFLDCTPCKAELPVVQSLYKAQRTKGLEVVLINSGDSAQRITQYLKDAGLELPIALDGTGAKFTAGMAYGVQAFPVSYLIGPNGEIMWRGIGLDETALKLALKDAGIE